MTDYSKFSTNWNYPTTIRFGTGRLKDLADTCIEFDIKKPLLVTDSGMANLPLTLDALESIRKGGLSVGVFSDIKPNPTGKNIADGLEKYHQGKHDGIIAFGGGSALDSGKAIGLMAGQSRPLWDFEDIGDNWKRVNEDGVAPIIAVPTTAGTGSEVGRSSVIVQEESQSKKIIFHPKMVPQVVISDPEATAGLPPGLTASTGMDALSHCLEAYSAPGFHPMADGIAVEGIRLILKWLPVAVKQGDNLEARANMLAAATMGATAFQKGLGAMHSLAHPIGAMYDAPHGLTNAVLMPFVLQFNRSAIEDKMCRLAAWLELPSSSFDAILDEIYQLRTQFDIPENLSKMGIDDTQAETIAQKAANDPTAPTNPIPVGNKEFQKIFFTALNGGRS